MMKKLLAAGLFLGMAGFVACDTQDEPAFEDDFQFEEAPPATPAPPMDPMMDTMADTLWMDTMPMGTGN